MVVNVIVNVIVDFIVIVMMIVGARLAMMIVIVIVCHNDYVFYFHCKVRALFLQPSCKKIAKCFYYFQKKCIFAI